MSLNICFPVFYKQIKIFFYNTFFSVVFFSFFLFDNNRDYLYLLFSAIHVTGYFSTSSTVLYCRQMFTEICGITFCPSVIRYKAGYRYHIVQRIEMAESIKNVIEYQRNENKKKQNNDSSFVQERKTRNRIPSTMIAQYTRF